MTSRNAHARNGEAHRQRQPFRSRAERLAAGDLIDVSDEARAARFAVPVALTAELASDIEDLGGHYILSTDTRASRLERLLHEARAHASRYLDSNRFSFSCYLPVGGATVYHVRLLLHAGDELENVITLGKETRPDHRTPGTLREER